MLKQIFAVIPCPCCYSPAAAASSYSVEQQRFYVSYSLREGCMVTTTSLSSNQVKYIVNHHVMVILTVNNICRDRANSSVLLVVVDGLCIVQIEQTEHSNSCRGHRQHCFNIAKLFNIQHYLCRGRSRN